jgi:hypothetical protein
MKLMIALKPHRYAGQPKERGDVYRVQGAGEYRLIKALGWAEDHIVPAPVAAVFAPFVVEQVEEHPAEEAHIEEPVSDEPEVEISLRTGKPKRQYKRRDMTAED